MKQVFLVISALFLLLFALTAIAADKVVVIPLNTKTLTGKLMGEGRPGVGLLTHDTANGYCTGPTGANFALSDSVSGWEGAASVCPANTWVCSLSELPSTGSCNIPLMTTISGIQCNGVTQPAVLRSNLSGWVADRHDAGKGYVENSSFLDSSTIASVCEKKRVWCCWN